jgi:DNA-binding transcriptional regulator YiaG
MTAAKLKESRESAGLTIKQAAEFSGTPYRTWHSWEQEGRDGRRPPGIAFSWLQLYVKQHQGS